MPSNAPETQFSIYRIDCERVERVLTMQSAGSAANYLPKVTHAIINSTISIVKKKDGLYRRIAYKNYTGVIFKTEHNPMWKSVLSQILDNNEAIDSSSGQGDKDAFLKNVNVSYILLYVYRENIYALTGGFGSMYITKFADKNFGMYLIPKIVTITTPVLRSIMQNYLTGNQLSAQRSNRKITSFNLEKNMSSIFRQLNIEIDDEIAKAFGIKLEPDERGKKISMVNKDSLVIHRSFSLAELTRIIHRLDELWKRDDNFALNYLVLAKKRAYKNAQLFDALKRTLKDLELSKFILVGDEYSNYIINGRRFVVCQEDGSEYLVSDSPILIESIFEEFANENRNVTLNFLDNFLKNWSIRVFDHDGNEIIPFTSIFDSIQGYVEFGTNGDPVYLFNGEWYVFDMQYAEMLSEEFKAAFERYKAKEPSVAGLHELKFESASEESYNRTIESIPNIIVAHKVTLDNVELADAIFADNDTLYLMHNKTKFGGEGARDVTGQVVTSSEYLQRLLSSQNRSESLRNYYRKIIRKRPSMSRKISEDEFLGLFANKTICYVVGYITNFRKETQATYAEFLTVETERTLAEKGYDFFSLSTTPEDVQ